MSTNCFGRFKRFSLIAVVGVTIAVIGNLAVVALMNLKAPPPPPVAPFFVERRAIQELARMAIEQPRDPDWHVRLGQALLDEGQYMSAADAFEKALKMGSTSAVIHQSLAICFTRLERFEEAEKQQAEVIRLSPSALGSDLGMVQIHMTAGEPKRALETLQRIEMGQDGYPIKTDLGGKYGALERIASFYGLLGDWDRAKALSAKILKESGSRPNSHIIMGKCLLARGEKKAALAHLRAGIASNQAPAELESLLVATMLDIGGAQNEAEALARLQRMATAQTATGEDFYRLGVLLEKREKWGPAAQAYDRAGRYRTRTAESLWKAYENYKRAQLREDTIYALGYYHESLGRLSQALVAYEGLTKIHSCCQSGYMHVARIYRMMGQPNKAIETLKVALKKPNPPPKVYSEVAAAYEAAKRLPEQQVAWERFIKLDAENADLGYQKLGLMANDSGNIQEAEEYFRKSIERQPTADLYRIRFAKLLLERRNDPARLKEAIVNLEEAQKSAPSNPEIYYQLGIAYQYAGRKEEAIQALRHSIDLDPGEGKPFQPLAQLLTDVGDQEGARFALGMYKRYRDYYRAWETLRARVGRNPQDVAAQRMLARFYDHSGALVDALGAYSKVLVLDPHDQHSRKRLTELYRELGQREIHTVPSREKTARI